MAKNDLCKEFLHGLYQEYDMLISSKYFVRYSPRGRKGAIIASLIPLRQINEIIYVMLAVDLTPSDIVRIKDMCSEISEFLDSLTKKPRTEIEQSFKEVEKELKELNANMDAVTAEIRRIQRACDVPWIGMRLACVLVCFSVVRAFMEYAKSPTDTSEMYARALLGSLKDMISIIEHQYTE